MNPHHIGPLSRDPLPMRGHTVVITGLSRRAGIGYATAAVMDGIRAHLVGEAQLADTSSDLTAEGAPEALMDRVVEHFGAEKDLICNQALTGHGAGLGELSAAKLDRHWEVNTRASILLAQEFTAHHAPGTPPPSCS